MPLHSPTAHLNTHKVQPYLCPVESKYVQEDPMGLKVNIWWIFGGSRGRYVAAHAVDG